MTTTGMALLRSQRGRLSAVAKALGVTRPAVACWRRVPAERVRAVSEITGIAPHDLRPDLFDAPEPAAPEKAA